MTQNKIYSKLREHLDTLPGGFRPTKNDSDINLLKNLYTEQEAELALNLTLTRETAATIAKRANLNLEEAKTNLEKMAEKGLIFSVETEEERLYQLAPWVIGIYEFQVNRLSDDFIQSMNDYYANRLPSDKPQSIPQMRTIPVNQSIDSKLEVLPYERVEELIDVNTKFGVASCICRTKEKKQGRGCDAPIETCIMFGDFADFYIRTGRGREVTKSEVKEILNNANKANLVLNPTNSKFVAAICCCCGDCCGILRGLQSHPKPSEAVASSFIVEFNSDLCIGCGVCVNRCQMGAISKEEPLVNVNIDRCIGCGLCVSTCPVNALTLNRKHDEELYDMPETFYDTWHRIAADQSKPLT